MPTSLPLALSLALSITLLAGPVRGQESLESRRARLRQEYARADSADARRAILHELRRMDRPRPVEEAEAELTALLGDPGRWSAEDRRRLIEAWRRLPPEIRRSIESIERRDICRAERIATHLGGVVTFEAIAFEDFFGDLTEQLFERLGPLFLDGFEKPPSWTLEGILYHEGLHAFQRTHPELVAGFLDLAFTDRLRRWREESAPLDAELRPLLTILARLRSEVPVDDELMNLVLEDIHDVHSRRMDLLKALGFPARHRWDFHAVEGDGREYFAMAGELLRHDPDRLAGVLTAEEMAWLAEHLPR